MCEYVCIHTYIHAKSQQLHVSFCRPLPFPQPQQSLKFCYQSFQIRPPNTRADLLHKFKLFAAVTQFTYQQRVVQQASMHSFIGRKVFRVNTFSFHFQIFYLTELLSVLMNSERCGNGSCYTLDNMWGCCKVRPLDTCRQAVVDFCKDTVAKTGQGHTGTGGVALTVKHLSLALWLFLFFFPA